MDVGDFLPDKGDVNSESFLDKMGHAAAWVADRPGAFWTIVICLVIAAIMTKALGNKLVQGILLGAVAVGIFLSVK